MGSLKGPVPSGQPVFSSSATQFHPLGSLFEDGFGRSYRYCLAGGTSLVVGDAIQSPAEVPLHQEMTPSAAAIGDKTVTFVLGSTLATANQYAGGILVIDLDPGFGYSYPIRSHLAADSGATLVVTLEPGWEIVVALTSTSRVTLALNPYSGVIICPATTATGTPAGVAQFIIVNAEYGWLGVHGPFGTKIEDTITLVSDLGTCVTDTAGGVTAHTGVLPIVGHIMRDGTDGRAQPFHWTLG